MGRRVLSATAEHVSAATSTPARRQPPPPQTLLPDDEQLQQLNEAGDPTAFRALTPTQRFEFDVRGYFVLRGHYSAAQVAQFNAGIDEVQALPKTQANFTQIGPLWSIPQDKAAMDDPTHGVCVCARACERACVCERARVCVLCVFPLYRVAIPSAPLVSSSKTEQCSTHGEQSTGRGARSHKTRRSARPRR